MTGKKWFYWLGKLHATRDLGRHTHCSWPEWAYEAYTEGWVNGFYLEAPQRLAFCRAGEWK